MGLLVNPLVILTQKDVTFWKVVTADPANGDFDGQTIINSATNEIKIWYNSTWNTLGLTITPGTLSYLLLEDGDYLLTEDGFKLILN